MRPPKAPRNMARRARPEATLVTSHFFRAHHRVFFPGTVFRAALVTDRHGSVASGRWIECWRLTMTKGRAHRSVDVFVNSGPAASIRTSFTTMRQIYSRIPNGRDLVAPRPLWLSSSGRIMAYEGLVGNEVRSLLESGQVSASTVNAVVQTTAHWLKRCHALRPAPGLRRPLSIPTGPSLPSVSLSEWRQVVKTIKSVERSRTLVHGDPHLANIIKHGRQLGLIDYSESHAGSGWEDVARFRVHLDVALHPYIPARQIEKIVAAVVTAYTGGRRLRRPELQALLAYQIVVINHFYLFTKRLNPRPRGNIAWILKRFVRRGRDDMQALLATT